MANIRATIIVAMIMLSSGQAAAQYYQIGADPSSARWRRIRSENFDVIYPQQTDSLARRYLYLFEKYRDLDNAGLKVESPRVPLVLHPWEVESNGTVVWAPKRAELFTTPPYNVNYAQNWDEQLAIHEGRHIGQMTHYTQGIFKFLNLLAGEQSIALGVGFYPSRSFLEGDAVANETDFSGSGRGRNADFLMYYRAAFAAGDYRTYDRWKFGSYVNYTPNRYAIGYLTMTGVRTQSDNYFATGDVMGRQVAWWWKIFNVSRKSYVYATGLSNRQNFKYAVSMMDSTWKADALLREPFTETVPLLQKDEKMYTDFTNVIPVKDGFITLRKGLQHSNYLTRIDSAGRQHPIRPFSVSTSRLDYDGEGTVIFSEIVPDPRWELRSYSIIRSCDTGTGKIKDLTRRTRYFNPVFSADNKSILAVEYRVEGGSTIVEIDRTCGETIRKIDAPDGYQITEVTQTGGILYATAVTPLGMGIFSYDGQSWGTTVREQNARIHDFQSDGTGLLRFVSDLDGVSDIYTLDPSTGELRMTVTARFGATGPTFSGDTVYYSDFTHTGYKPVLAILSGQQSKPASFDRPHIYEVAEIMSAQAAEHTNPLTDEEDAALRSSIDSLESRPYSKLGHALRIHSWAPFYANIDRIMDMSFEHIYQLASPGVTLISQNDLGTLVATGGYGYHGGFHSGHLNVNYSGLYPVMELAVDYNDRHCTSTCRDFDGLYVTDTLDRPSLEISANVYVPINLSEGGWSSGLIPQIKYTFSNDIFSNDISCSFGTPARSLLYSARWYRVLSTPSSKLVPRWGFGAVASVKQTTGTGSNSGMLGYVNLYGYLPGITRNQGVKLTFSHQRQFRKDRDSFLPNIASMPRGFSSRVLGDYSKATIDYSIPIYAFESSYCFLGYLKRFNLTPFADFAHDRTQGVDNPFLYSYGSLLSAKFHLFKFGFSFDLGVRWSRTSEKTNDFKLVFSSSL